MTQPAPAAPAVPTPPAPVPSGPSALNSHGYPDNTPVDQMSTEHALAYWKRYARHHEDRAKGVDDLREKAGRLDALEAELGSDKDKAVAAAKAEATKEANASFLPRLVAAEFRAAATGRLTAEQTAALIEDLDLAKFVTDRGDIDAEKIGKKIEALAPATGTQPLPRGPSAQGMGSTPPVKVSGREQGLAEANKRFPKKT